MNLPTQAQVNTAGRYIGTIAGTAIAIFGLQAKGVSLDQVNAVIAAGGTVVNDIIVLIGAALPMYTAIKGVMSSSSTGQAFAIGANKKTIVNPGSNGKAIVTLTDEMATAALEGQRKAS